MKILAVSDMESKYIWDFFDPAVFSGIDLMISCGDLSARYLDYLVTMIPAPLLYVHGNHDKTYVTDPPTGCDSIDGKIVRFRDLRILGLGGCKSLRPSIHEYNEHQMWRKVRKLEYSIRRLGGIDILVTHAPSIGYGDQPGGFHEGFEAFHYLTLKYKPMLHLFGHIHLKLSPVNSRAVMKLGDTTLINASGYRIIEL